MNLYSADWLGNNQAKYTSYFLADRIGDVSRALRLHLAAQSATGKPEDLADMESVNVQRIGTPSRGLIFRCGCEVYVVGDQFGDRIAVRLEGERL